MAYLTKDTALQYVKGVGPKLALRFQKLGLFTCEDLCLYFPKKFDDRRFLPKIKQLNPDQQTAFIAKITAISAKKTRENKSLITCTLADNTGTIKALWFNQSYMQKTLKIGDYIYVKGKLDHDSYSNQQILKVTETEKINIQQTKQQTAGIIPIYGLCAGLLQYQIRNIVREILPLISAQITDPIPAEIKQHYQLIDKKTALTQLHFPNDIHLFNKAKYRIIFEEFLIYQLQVVKHKQNRQQKPSTHPLVCNGPLLKRYLQQLPYQLTEGQQMAINDIKKDLCQKTPMNRLVQGDVGCGKTEVAITSILMALDSQKVAAFMAPTQILAEQHYIKLSKLTQTLEIEVFLLKGKQNKKQKEATKQYLKTAKACIVVGTHALIQDDVQIPNLALLVIDEQHRFGVLQRLKLQQSQNAPHALYLTATPIPRTFMLTCYGDLDKSIIKELPSIRKPISTYLAKPSSLPKVLVQCQKRCQQNEQLYIVYPLVEESENSPLTSAQQGLQDCQKACPNLKMDLLHGQLKPDQKTKVMAAFKDKKIQVLVSTTVIEVGVDVPAATMMIIMHAERFGLSQLHQLRGRVGRGSKASTCYLVANPKSDTGKQRIKALLDHSNGFEIAEIDLKLRGPGDMIGTQQAGLPQFNLADVIRDEAILKKAYQCASHLVQNPDFHHHPNYQALNQAINQQQKFKEELNLN